jgi:RhoGAP domain
MSWIYEVPLSAVHHLSEALNAIPPEKPIPVEVVTQFNAPVIASTVKLWALELDPPLALYEGWEEIRKLYRVKGEEQQTEEQHIQNLGAALLKLPRVHLYALDLIVKHLKT